MMVTNYDLQGYDERKISQKNLKKKNKISILKFFKKDYN